MRSRQIWLAFAAILTWGTPLLAQSGHSASEGPALDISDRPVSMPRAPVSVDFKLRDNLVTLIAMIDGREHEVVLDSGASGIIVDQAFARRYNLVENLDGGDVAVGGGQAQQVRPVQLASLVVGPLRFAKLSDYSTTLSQLSASAGFPVDLLVGAPAFKHGVVSIDYKRHRVTFGPIGSAPRCSKPIPLEIIHDVPVVTAQLQPKAGSATVSLKLIVDLGTRHQSVAIGGPFVRSAVGQSLIRSGTAQKVGHGIGGGVRGTIARVAELRLGQAVVADLDVALSSEASAFEAGAVDGSLGVPFWKDAVITFNYPDRSLCIER